MRLGEVVQISIGVPSLSASKEFYLKLGFELLGQHDQPWPWAQLTDGQNLVLINQDGNRYVGLNYFSAAMSATIEEVEAMGISFLHRGEGDAGPDVAIFMDADGLMVGLIDQDPQGMTLPEGKPLSKCGKFGEFSLKVADFDAAMNYWQRFGFDTRYQSADPYPWGILDDGLIVLGLHEADSQREVDKPPLEWNGPALTYFAPDMPQRLQELHEQGVTYLQEIADDEGVINSAVLATPGGERIFLFEGDV